ncbi:methyltransferase domain-containing protein [Halomonas sp. Bachu 37]|uniref:methyltransferase domain-containing protein n=1 Tax=Halomonas kashgarensis TaxID=3084920 RepID=UPI0032172E6F
MPCSSDPPSVNHLTAAGDRYFDGLAEKFSRTLYNAPRGELRLALLDKLLPEMLQLERQPCLDVGGGLGQLSAWLTQRGHPLTLAEPSAEMLAHAREALKETPVTLLQASLQELAHTAPGPWPLIVCHAVLEWLGDPRAALARLADLLAPGGQLSLMVFNRDALRFSNIIKGNLEKAWSERLAGTGQRQRLTPISPLSHDEILAWAQESGLEMTAVAGVRVFQDYLRQAPLDAEAQAHLLALELRHSRSEPHWRLGRYLLYTLVKPESD